jgi:hypothetical protein
MREHRGEAMRGHCEKMVIYKPGRQASPEIDATKSVVF